MPRGKNCARQFLPLSCCAITLTVGAILKEEMTSLLGGEAIWEAFFETIRVRVIPSQKLPRDWGVICCRALRCLAGPSGYRSPSTQHPETDPKRNRPETDPKKTRNGAETEPKWTETKPSESQMGRPGGVVGTGGPNTGFCSI